MQNPSDTYKLVYQIIVQKKFNIPMLSCYKENRKKQQLIKQMDNNHEMLYLFLGNFSRLLPGESIFG